MELKWRDEGDEPVGGWYSCVEVWVSTEWVVEVGGQARGSKIWWICKTARAK